MEKKRYNGIDIFRLIGAIFVIALHTEYGHLDIIYVDNLRLLARWAVPFYFMATGFFLSAKKNNHQIDIRNIEGNIATLFSISIITNIIYFPIEFLKGRHSFSIINLFVGVSSHLWFMGSLLFGYFFIWYLYFINKRKILPFISILIIIYALYSDSYDQIFNVKIDFRLAQFLLSVPFLHFGLWMAERNRIKIDNKIVIGVIINGIMLQTFEAKMFESLFSYNRGIHQFLFATLLIVIPLFIYSLQININENILTRCGRKYSLLIYY